MLLSSTLRSPENRDAAGDKASGPRGQAVRHCLASQCCVLARCPTVSKEVCGLFFRVKFKILLKAIHALAFEN